MVIAAVKLTISAWVCAVERAAASASGGLIIPALRLLVVAVILFSFLRRKKRRKKVDGRTVGQLTADRLNG